MHLKAEETVQNKAEKQHGERKPHAHRERGRGRTRPSKKKMKGKQNERKTSEWQRETLLYI